MTATEVITLPLGRVLGSGGADRPALVRVVKPSGDELREGVTIWRIPQGATVCEVERRLQRIPKLMSRDDPSKDSFAILEKWDGVVISVDSETFEARLYKSGNKGRTKLAEFSKMELSPEERGQIAEGATFVWTIGYRNIGITRYRDSVIYFRRLPVWDEQELAAGIRHGAELTNSIGWK